MTYGPIQSEGKGPVRGRGIPSPSSPPNSTPEFLHPVAQSSEVAYRHCGTIPRTQQRRLERGLYADAPTGVDQQGSAVESLGGAAGAGVSDSDQARRADQTKPLRGDMGAGQRLWWEARCFLDKRTTWQLEKRSNKPRIVFSVPRHTGHRQRLRSVCCAPPYGAACPASRGTTTPLWVTCTPPCGAQTPRFSVFCAPPHGDLLRYIPSGVLFSALSLLRFYINAALPTAPAATQLYQPLHDVHQPPTMRRAARPSQVSAPPEKSSNWPQLLNNRSRRI